MSHSLVLRFFYIQNAVLHDDENVNNDMDFKNIRWNFPFPLK